MVDLPLACTPGKSLEPVFMIRTIPCNDTSSSSSSSSLPTYLMCLAQWCDDCGRTLKIPVVPMHLSVRNNVAPARFAMA
jgi:hypothetical protein